MFPLSFFECSGRPTVLLFPQGQPHSSSSLPGSLACLLRKYRKESMTGEGSPMIANAKPNTRLGI